MSIRAVILGLFGAVLMGAGGGYASKHIPGMWGLVRGHLPVSVFGFLILFVIFINPLFRRIHRSLRFRAGEIALIVSLTLIGCAICDAGLMRYFPKSLVQPMQLARSRPGWQQKNLLQHYAPDEVLPNKGEDSEEVVDNYVSPMGTEDDPISLGEVPWQAWQSPLKIWGGIIGFMFAGIICLAVVVHRQWADKERIRYPIAEIVSSLLARDENGNTKILQNKIFWLGLGIPLVLRLMTGLNEWFPDFPAIPLRLDLSPLSNKFPEFASTSGAGSIIRPAIYPACVGLAFLLASELSLTLGIAPLVAVLVMFTMVTLGIDISGRRMEGSYIQWQIFGSFVAMAVMLFYVGRCYYWQTLCEALTFRKLPETQTAGVWALRGFIICMIGTVGILMAVGVDWIVSVLAVLTMMILYLICARMNAEAGTFFFAPIWTMPGVLAGLYGLTALGPRVIIVLGLMLYMLAADPFETLMPFVSNGLKIAGDAKLKVGKVAGWMIIALLLALAIGIPLSIWADYNFAAPLRRGWDTEEVFVTADKTVDRLTLSGETEKVMAYDALGRISNMIIDTKFLLAFGIGFGLLMLFSMLRLKYTWWPIHPILFLVFGSTFFAKFGFSFFLGWVIKTSVSKFGGAAKYLEVKPMMIGLIVGDLLGGVFWLIVGWIYYGVTGYAGPSILLW